MRTYPPLPLSPAATDQPYCSGYSAHEHTALYSNARYSTTMTSASAALPQDMVIEALVALVVVSVGLVLGAEQLKPISWSVWAGQIEREGGERNPYRRLEERTGFMDIRVSALRSVQYRYSGCWGGMLC